MNVKFENTQPNVENPKISCFSGHNPPSLITHQHIHDEIEIIYIKKGSAYAEIDTESIYLAEGNILFINRLLAHNYSNISKDFECIIMQFRPQTVFDNKMVEIKHLIPFYHTSTFHYYINTYNDTIAHEIHTCLSDILEVCNEKFDLAQDLILNSLLIKLLYITHKYDIYNLGERNLTEREKSIKRIINLQKYINAHYAEALTVSFACEYVKLDYHYFSRLFKQETGKNFIDYLNSVRIINAQQLLTSTNQSIAFISQNVGFQNPSYFNRVFKSLCGITPKEYRINR